ncbi:MAG TPA: hypothetical protein VNY36_03395, partial [Bacteroidia bacterium]|nr:hypothetical protein [Bacteroidia bacterium]
MKNFTKRLFNALTGALIFASSFSYAGVTAKGNSKNNANFNSYSCPTITITISGQTNVSCNGGSNGAATVTASGGVSPYTYSWTGGAGTNATATNLAAGTYTVTVHDANLCPGTKVVTITQPAALVVTGGTPTSASCNQSNGAAIVTVTGGTTPYSYSWSPTGGTNATANNIAAGSYTCTVTDNKGCVSSNTKLVQNTGMTATISSQTDVTCRGGSNGTATASMMTGTSPYTYSWFPSGQVTKTATGLTAEGITSGLYTVTVTDHNGCEGLVRATIGEPTTAVSVIITSHTNAASACNSNGTAVALASGGGSPYTYSWLPSTGVTGANTASPTTMAGATYTVIATDHNGCTANASVTISQPSAVTANIGGVSNATCNAANNGTATVTPGGGTSPYTYSWSNGETTSSVSDLSQNTYTATVKDASNCTATATVSIGAPVALGGSISNPINPTCHGFSNGAATANGSGGTSPYTYLWNDGETTATATSLAAGTSSVQINDANHCGPVTYTVSLGQPAALSGVISGVNNVTCNAGNNGGATITASGGSGSYTYSWNDGETNATASTLSAGINTITINDAVCGSISYTVSISAPSALGGSISNPVNPTCNGYANGAATAAGSGGTTPYTYLWNDGETTATATSLGNGVSSVQINDANHCGPVTYTVSLTAPAVLSATMSGQTNPTCHTNSNGIATANVSGGTSPYTYSWSDGETTATATGLPGGSSTVQINDANHCGPVTYTVTLTSPSAVTATITGESDVTCNGGNNGSATVTAGGGNGHFHSSYTYSWAPVGGTFPTASGLSAGIYTVTVTDQNNCTATATVAINQPNALTASIGTVNNVTCNGGSNGNATVNVSGGTTPYNYSWSPTGGNGATASNLTAGIYTVTVSDLHSCGPVTATVNVTQPTPVGATISGQTNPTCFGYSNGIAIATGNGGTSPYTYLWSDGETTATANTLPAGNNTVQVTDIYECTSVTYTVNLTSPAVLSGNTYGQVNPTCFGLNNGIASANGNGGTSPYTYSWSDGETTETATGLGSGVSSVQINDANNCGPVTYTVSLTAPTQLTCTISGQTNLTCFGVNTGSATANVSGGTTPYSYSWSDGETTATASSLPAGNNTVQVNDANHCGPLTYTVTLTSPTALSGTIYGQVNPTCFSVNNGIASANGFGGTSPYTYSWSDGETTETATSLAAGVSSVQINDANHCGPVTYTVNLTAPTALTGGISNPINPSCNSYTNGGATANVSGGTSPYTYLWSDGETTAVATALGGGINSVQINDANHCGPLTYTVSLTAPSAIVINSTSSTPSSGSNGTATINASGGTGALTYSWSPSGETDATATGLNPGTYTVSVMDANECGPVTATVNVGSTGGCSAPASPTICYVTADTSLNNNVVYWDTTGLATANIQTFNVYRKATTGYILIGSVPSNADFTGDFSFTDNTSNTDKESYFYELTSVNYCSDESDASPYHQTMLLQANLGVGNVVNLDWNEYVGNTVNYYVVLRDTGTGFMRYDSVPSGSSAYTDLTPTLSKPTLAYMVNAVWTLACSPSTMSHS